MIKQTLSAGAIPADSKIDEAAGIIRGVSVITEGEALGHPWRIDATTLQQVKAAADTQPDGVKVKVNHGTGFESIVGNLKNFRIQGKKVLADLHLIKSHEKFRSIMEIAKTMPASVGLSITFALSKEKKDGIDYARCSELYSVDLVDEPAANPSGLFSARTETRPSLERLQEIAGNVFYYSMPNYRRMSEGALFAALEKEAFQNHVRIPGMDTDERLAARLHRIDPERVVGVRRTEAAHRQQLINQILSRTEEDKAEMQRQKVATKEAASLLSIRPKRETNN